MLLTFNLICLFSNELHTSALKFFIPVHHTSVKKQAKPFFKQIPQKRALSAYYVDEKGATEQKILENGFI